MPDPDDHEGGDDADADAEADADVDDATVVRTAAEAAENVVFSRFDTAEVSDLDVTVSFEDRVLDVDVYVDADGGADPERVAEDAALAAQGAVDELFD